ncbi:MAG: hypothetical protein Q8Q33_01625, partial [Chlamydiota bacterium]|nr:hypothetical protein [Chlamydiota bacterium]
MQIFIGSTSENVSGRSEEEIGFIEASEYRFKFFYAEGLGLFFAVIDPKGRFLIVDPTAYFEEAFEGYGTKSAERVTMVTDRSFDDYIQSDSARIALSEWVMRRDAKSIVRSAITLGANIRKGYVMSTERIRNRINEFNKRGFKGTLDTGGAYGFNVHEYRGVKFWDVGEPGQEFSMQYHYDDELGLLASFHIGDQFKLYSFETYARNYRDGEPQAQRAIYAIPIPTEGYANVDAAIAGAKKDYIVDSHFQTENLREILQEYIQVKLNGMNPNAEWVGKVNRFEKIFFTTDLSGVKAISLAQLKTVLRIQFPEGKGDYVTEGLPDQFPDLSVPVADASGRSFLYLHYDKKNKELELRAIEEKTGAGFVFSLKRVVKDVRKNKESVSAEKISSPMRKRANMSGIKIDSKSNVDQLKFGAMQIVAQSGFYTVWDFLKQLTNQPVMSPIERRTALRVYKELAEFYHAQLGSPDASSSVFQENLERLRIDIQRLQLFLQDPYTFRRSVSLGEYGTYRFREGAKWTHLVMTHNALFENLDLTEYVRPALAIRQGPNGRNPSNAAKILFRIIKEGTAYDHELADPGILTEPTLQELFDKGYLVKIEPVFTQSWSSDALREELPLMAEHPVTRELVRYPLHFDSNGNALLLNIGGTLLSAKYFHSLFGSARSIEEAGLFHAFRIFPGLESATGVQTYIASKTGSFALSEDSMTSRATESINEEINRDLPAQLAGIEPATETQSVGETVSFMVGNINDVPRQVAAFGETAAQLAKLIDVLDEDTKRFLKKVRLVAIGSQVEVMTHDNGELSFAHIGFAGHMNLPTLYIGRVLLKYMLTHDQDALVTLMRIEMNRIQYRLEKETADNRSTQEVVKDAEVHPAELEALKKAIAEAQAEHILKSVLEGEGSPEVLARAIQIAAEYVDTLTTSASIAGIPIALRGYLLDAVVRRVAEKMKVPEDAVHLTRSADQIRVSQEAQRLKVLGDLISQQMDAQTEGIEINTLMGEMRLFRGIA